MILISLFHRHQLPNGKGIGTFARVTSTLAAFGAVLGVWQIIALFLSDTRLFPPPYAVLMTLVQDIPIGELLSDCYASLRRVLIGTSFAVVVGIPVGLLLGVIGRTGVFIERMLEFIRPISPIAWIPIAILWLGIGEASAYLIIFIAAFFPIFTSTYDGAKSVSSIHLLLAKSLHMSKKQYVWTIVFPSSLPRIISGFRIGIGIAWMAVIASEMVAAESGLGYMIQLNRLLTRSRYVLAGMVTIGVVGFGMNQIVKIIGNILTPWIQHEEKG